ALAVEIEIGVRSAGAQRGIFVSADDLKWRGRGSIETELVGKRQYIEDAEPCANGGLPIFAWIPGEADARFEVFGGGVIGNGTAGSDWTAGGCARGAIDERLDLLTTRSGHGV